MKDQPIEVVGDVGEGAQNGAHNHAVMQLIFDLLLRYWKPKAKQQWYNDVNVFIAFIIICVRFSL
jgi:hypothetical protein